MSEKTIKDQIALIRGRIGEGFAYEIAGRVKEEFFEDVNELQEIYGSFIGRAKITHQDYSEELQAMDEQISAFFIRA